MKIKLSTFIIAAIGLIGLWVVLAWVPMSREMKMISSRTAAAKLEIADYDNTISQLPAMMQTKAELDSRRRQQHSSLYAKEDMLRLFTELETHARGHNLAVFSITPPIEELLTLNRTVQYSGDPAFLNISMKLRGNYFNFSRFVLELEAAPYFRGITACRVVDEDADPDRLQCLIGFRALLGDPEETI